MNSLLDWQINIEKIEKAAEQCAGKGVKYLFLPECFLSMGDGVTMTPHLVEENNEMFLKLSEISKSHKVFLVAGSAATKSHDGVRNRVYNFNDKGELISTYDKRKLFSCDLGKGKRVDEGDLYTQGSEQSILNLEEMKIGLGVCFDVRFSDLALNYKKLGCNVLTYSAAFTVPTGKAHWHTLLRARAIENQCYVIAPAQVGKHNDRVETYGHSLVVDPWGEVILDMGDKEGLDFCEIDLAKVTLSRARVIMGDLN